MSAGPFRAVAIRFRLAGVVNGGLWNDVEPPNLRAFRYPSVLVVG